MRIKLKLKEFRDWILWLIQGVDITLGKVFLDLLSSSTNQGSLAKYICPVILYVIMLWLCSKGRSNKLPRRSFTLDITQAPLGSLCVHSILTGSSGRIVSHICEDTSIWLLHGISLIIHGLWTVGYKIVSYQGILVPRLNSLCYLLFFWFYSQIGA